MSYHGARRKMTIIDYLRGWHWNKNDRIRNWCGCKI